ncbi:chemotaxis protein CheX [Planctomicrobium sp. SH661]|uniref:chemotaxis protein CheX n=1 Tax=Planctomicrobium sp. SH661 TaxID=3448124 RepID=UPI003F5B47B1
MEVDNTLLEQIATDVLNGMLGLEFHPSQDPEDDPAGLMASIRICGDWHAGLDVVTPMSSARRIAEQMFGTSPDDLAEAEIADALGEIANMIGGNLKGLSQGETRLSLPCVGPAALDDQTDSSQDFRELHLRFGNERLSLRLHQEVSLAATR